MRVIKGMKQLTVNTKVDAEIQMLDLRDGLVRKHGPGTFRYEASRNVIGLMLWTFVPSNSDVLSEEQVEAIRHARVIMCNATRVKLNPMTNRYVPLHDDDTDPALPNMVRDINILCEIFEDHQPTLTAS